MEFRALVYPSPLLPFHAFHAMRFTLAQAAERVGVEKSTLYKKIRRGEISAHRAEDGRFFIDAAELFRAYPEAEKAVDQLGSSNGISVEAARIADLEKMVGLLESERDFLRERLIQADEERRKLSAMLTDQSAKNSEVAAPSGRASLLEKLFGRRGE